MHSIVTLLLIKGLAHDKTARVPNLKCLLLIGFSLIFGFQVEAQPRHTIESIKDGQILEITGVLERSDSQIFVYFTAENEIWDSANITPTKINYDERFEIVPLTAETNITLKKMKSGDYLRARAEKRGGALLISQIDFVGLVDLLGVWVAPGLRIRFADFSRVYTHTRTKEAPRSTLSVYQYTVAPSNSSSWNLFLSTQNEVSLVKVSFVEKNLSFTMLDINTGEEKEQILLEKLR